MMQDTSMPQPAHAADAASESPTTVERKTLRTIVQRALQRRRACSDPAPPSAAAHATQSSTAPPTPLRSCASRSVDGTPRGAVPFQLQDMHWMPAQFRLMPRRQSEDHGLARARGPSGSGRSGLARAQSFKMRTREWDGGRGRLTVRCPPSLLPADWPRADGSGADAVTIPVRAPRGSVTSASRGAAHARALHMRGTLTGHAGAGDAAAGAGDARSVAAVTVRTAVAPEPSRRGLSACVGLDGRVYAFGGIATNGQCVDGRRAARPRPLTE